MQGLRHTILPCNVVFGARKSPFEKRARGGDSPRPGYSRWGFKYSEYRTWYARPQRRGAKRASKPRGEQEKERERPQERTQFASALCLAVRKAYCTASRVLLLLLFLFH